ncbi:Hypothetical protein I595_3216 [Croceitalea dokdonensis DOKDO 023]|uniref:DUF3570 domain-containing protein n=1 Tax=Croceitalea dokdonensis DOKDO 023 TaxID=1300341 RepID=A0A0P7ANS1_9FLAO|nr:DUF3570 domain-containing protein [Croceitalea dokdonensis]KPM30719.1 Hypothetical protein I595_3216 [Croceitalea dokdonensis DOKDO 023]
MRKRYICGTVWFLLGSLGYGQQTDTPYKKRVLEASELDMLFSYYSQEGQNAAVNGGEGTEELIDATSTIVLRMPLNSDDVLTVDAGISAYTSASSSNINPFDGTGVASPFDASSGESRQDVLAYVNPSYAHSSNDRNRVWSTNAYVSNEYDYLSLGFGGSYAYLFNEKNTEVYVGAQVYLDRWDPQYPVELRGDFAAEINGYNPDFERFDNVNRNSFSLSLGFSQILGKRLQGALSVDIVQQEGLLSTPFQRVYFGDRADFFVEDFQLADDVERLPATRFKIPIGGRLNYYLNDFLIIRSFYRYYLDDWGLRSHTASLETPIKLNDKFTLYPSYRYYQQSGMDYFFEKERATSDFEFYTSDFDLSNYTANQFGFGIQYKDIFTTAKLLLLGLKTVDLRYNFYDRSDGLSASIVTLGTTFIID